MRLCPSGEERDGEGGAKSMAWRGQAALARSTPCKGRRVPRLADHTGLSILLRERKGSSPWCSPKAAGLRGRAVDALQTPQRAPARQEGVCHVAHPLREDRHPNGLRRRHGGLVGASADRAVPGRVAPEPSTQNDENSDHRGAYAPPPTRLLGIIRAGIYELYGMCMMGGMLCRPWAAPGPGPSRHPRGRP